MKRLRGLPKNLGTFKERARTGCRMPLRRQMGLPVCFVNQCANSCQRTTSKETVETRSYGTKLFLWSNSAKFWAEK
jgi:hypothetical protein